MPSRAVGCFTVLKDLPGSSELESWIVWHPFRRTTCTLSLFSAAALAEGAGGAERTRERLLHAGRQMARLTHANLVPVTDVVTHRDPEQGDRCGLVVEGEGGFSLREFLAESGALDVEDALSLLRQVTAGVAALHRAGLVHGDLRPENVLLEIEEDRVLARVQSAARGTLRCWDRSSPYLAPEQLRGDPVSPAADIFALGCLLYECLTARLPYGNLAFAAGDRAGLTPDQIAAALSDIHRASEQGDLTPLPSHLPHLPASLAAAVRAALSPDPDARFPDCAAFLAALPQKAPPPADLGEEAPIPAAEGDEAPSLRPPPPAVVRPRAPDTLATRAAAGAFDAFFRGVAAARVVMIPTFAILALVGIWTWGNFQEARALKGEIRESRSGLDPLIAEGRALADDVIAAGVEANHVRPLLERYDAAESEDDRLVAAQTMAWGMLRQLRSLPEPAEPAQRQERRQLELRLNALTRRLDDYHRANASLQAATQESVGAWFANLMR